MKVADDQEAISTSDMYELEAVLLERLNRNPKSTETLAEYVALSRAINQRQAKEIAELTRQQSELLRFHGEKITFLLDAVADHTESLSLIADVLKSNNEARR